MSGGWQVGMLAVCIDSSDQPWMNAAGEFVSGPSKNEILKVIRVSIDQLYGRSCVALHFAEYDDGEGFNEHSFRPVKPDTEPCEEEFTVLIKRGRKVSA